ALAMRETLVSGNPGDIRLIVDLGATRGAIGRLEWRLGRPADAMRAWDQTREGLESARAAHPGDPAGALQLAAMEAMIGHSLAESALWEDAAAAFDRAAKNGWRDRLAALSRASLLAVTGNRELLEAQCGQMLDDYGQCAEATFANRLARRCALAP